VASGVPRSRGDREALRVLVSTRASAVTARTRAINHLKALIISAPDELRAELRGKTSDAQISYCAALRPRPSRDIEHRTTVRVLRSTAQRILTLRQEADELEADIQPLVAAMQPELLTLPGVGPISAAQILISWSHPGRFRSEAAFAAFSGAAPIPASSGLTNRHRLNRSGDRQLNRALHTSFWPEHESTPTPAPTSPDARAKAKPLEKRNGASNASSPAKSTNSSRRHSAIDHPPSSPLDET
jgi:transposase